MLRAGPGAGGAERRGRRALLARRCFPIILGSVSVKGRAFEISETKPEIRTAVLSNRDAAGEPLWLFFVDYPPLCSDIITLCCMS